MAPGVVQAAPLCAPQDEDAAIALWQLNLAAGLSGDRFRRARAVVARALAQRAGAECGDHRRRTGRRADRIRHHRRDGLSRPAGGRPRSLGLRTRRHAGRRGKTPVARRHHAAGQHRQRPRDPLLRAQRLCPMPARTSIRPRDGRCCGWSGRGEAVQARSSRHTPRKRGIQYAAPSRFNNERLWNTGSSAGACRPAGQACRCGGLLWVRMPVSM